MIAGSKTLPPEMPKPMSSVPITKAMRLGMIRSKLPSNKIMSAISKLHSLPRRFPILAMSGDANANINSGMVVNMPAIEAGNPKVRSMVGSSGGIMVIGRRRFAPTKSMPHVSKVVDWFFSMRLFPPQKCAQ